MVKPRKTFTKNNTSFSLSSSSPPKDFFIPKEVEPILLKCLPIKSLLQYRVVSKTWQSIIDNPTFAHARFSYDETRREGSRILLSFSNPDGSRHYLYSVGVFGGRATHLITLHGCNYDDSSLGQSSRCYIFPPVKGLVCLLDAKKNISLCNPSTRKVITLPQPCHNQNTSKDLYFQKSFSSYSFGYDSCTKIYKILHVFGTISREDNKLYNVETRVLSIGTPSVSKLGSNLWSNIQDLDEKSENWRKIDASFPYPYPFLTQGVFVDGLICWVGLKSPGEKNIVAFDLTKEKFHLIPSPPNGIPLTTTKLLNIGEKLGILSTKDFVDLSLELWVHDVKNSTWVKKDVGSHVGLAKKGVNPNFPAFIGSYCIGDMIMTPDVLMNTFVLRNLDDAKEVGMKISGLPAFVEMLGYKEINLSVYNFVESIMPLDIVVRYKDLVDDVKGLEISSTEQAALKRKQDDFAKQKALLEKIKEELAMRGKKKGVRYDKEGDGRRKKNIGKRSDASGKEWVNTRSEDRSYSNNNGNNGVNTRSDNRSYYNNGNNGMKTGPADRVYTGNGDRVNTRTEDRKYSNNNGKNRVNTHPEDRTYTDNGTGDRSYAKNNGKYSVNSCTEDKRNANGNASSTSGNVNAVNFGKKWVKKENAPRNG